MGQLWWRSARQLVVADEAVNDAAVIAVYKTAVGGSYDGRGRQTRQLWYQVRE